MRLGIRHLLAAASAGLATLLPAAPAVHAATPASSVQSLDIVSYIGPKDTPWAMWNNWEPANLDADFAAIAALNANTVRLFVDPAEFGFPTPSAAAMGKLAKAVQTAQAHGLRVYLNLFDRFSNFAQIPQSAVWADEVMKPYAGDPEVAAFEVFNEVDTTNTGQRAWLKAMIPTVQQLSGGIPMGVSICGCDNTGTLQVLHNQLAETQPDFYSFHYYTDVATAQQQAQSVFASARAIVAPLPLIVGETGFSTGPAATGGSDPTLEQEQAQWFQAVEPAAVAGGLGTAGVWTLEDFTAVNPNPAQQFFGLIRTDGTQKPAASVIASTF